MAPYSKNFAIQLSQLSTTPDTVLAAALRFENLPPTISVLTCPNHLVQTHPTDSGQGGWWSSCFSHPPTFLRTQCSMVAQGMTSILKFSGVIACCRLRVVPISVRTLTFVLLSVHFTLSMRLYNHISASSLSSSFFCVHASHPYINTDHIIHLR
ncbi:hypothetical protein ElyMa_004822800 [Elysia marginata]|uniref:Uncharacterized protein n=1 Tax=Elysia marginata TaxID=1093978 RepID=A0AAV4IKS8_9GAST|nr:hypothetical protein ElyMa_004822800 [Elysia marginata]